MDMPPPPSPAYLDANAAFWAAHLRTLRVPETDVAAAAAALARAPDVSVDTLPFVNDARLVHLGLADAGARSRLLAAIYANSTRQAALVVTQAMIVPPPTSDKTPLLGRPGDTGAFVEHMYVAADSVVGVRQPQGVGTCRTHGYPTTAACALCLQPVCGLCGRSAEVFASGHTRQHVLGGVLAGVLMALFGCFACIPMVIMRSQGVRSPCVRACGSDDTICVDCQTVNDKQRTSAGWAYGLSALGVAAVLYSIAVIVVFVAL